MNKWDKVIEMLMNGVSKDLAEQLLKEFCPKMFGLENDKSAVQDYGCTRCDICWSSKINE